MRIVAWVRSFGGGLRRWIDRHTALPMLGAAVLGVGLAVGALVAFSRACAPDAEGLCRMAHNNPPWLLITSLVAGPSALLTWYWRTAHKKAEMATAIRAQVAQRFATAVELLEKKGVASLGAIYALEQIAKDSPDDQWTITETLAAFIRSAKAEAELRPSKQAALTVLARRDRQRDRSGGVVDLRGAVLAFLNFDGLNLQGFDLTDSAVDGSTFRKGADVTGAVFSPARLYHPDQDYDQSNTWDGPDHPQIDDSLRATDEQMGVFLALKADNEDEARRAEQRAAEPPPAPHDPSG